MWEIQIFWGKESASADSLRKGGNLCARNVMLLINKWVAGALAAFAASLKAKSLKSQTRCGELKGGLKGKDVEDPPRREG